MDQAQALAVVRSLANGVDPESGQTITAEIRAEKKKTKNTDDAVMKVVRKVFRETTPVRFEGNNYADSWVKEAARRGLPNLRRAPEGLAELTTNKAHNVLVGLGVLTDAEKSTYDAYLAAFHFITILQARARRVLSG